MGYHSVPLRHGFDPPNFVVFAKECAKTLGVRGVVPQYPGRGRPRGPLLGRTEEVEDDRGPQGTDTDGEGEGPRDRSRSVSGGRRTRKRKRILL